MLQYQPPASKTPPLPVNTTLTPVAAMPLSRVSVGGVAHHSAVDTSVSPYSDARISAAVVTVSLLIGMSNHSNPGVILCRNQQVFPTLSPMRLVGVPLL